MRKVILSFGGAALLAGLLFCTACNKCCPCKKKKVDPPAPVSVQHDGAHECCPCCNCGGKCGHPNCACKAEGK